MINRQYNTVTRCFSALLAVWLSGNLLAVAADAPVAKTPASPTMPAAADLRKAIDRGIEFLLQSQNQSGWWSTPDQPAVTALALTALNLEPSGRFQRNRSSELNHAYDFILSSAKPDGSIQRSGLANYNTSLSIVALTTSFDTNFLPVIIAGRKYIASTQAGTNQGVFAGGIGYGDHYIHSDMANTITAIEAMRFSETVLPKDKPDSPLKEADVDWKAVTSFLQNCQNLPSVNQQDWVSGDAKDRGGFVYFPGESKAGGVTNVQTGRVALRSYGSMSYGGLLSYIYASVDKKDPRVQAVLNWLRDNYTVEENPAMNQQGYFYYLHLMTKALTAAGVDKLKLADGREVDWRADVASRLLKLQKPNGAWINPEKRWWEADPVLVTSYAMMTLEMIHAHSNH